MHEVLDNDADEKEDNVHHQIITDRILVVNVSI